MDLFSSFAPRSGRRTPYQLAVLTVLYISYIPKLSFIILPSEAQLLCHAPNAVLFHLKVAFEKYPISDIPAMIAATPPLPLSIRHQPTW